MVQDLIIREVDRRGRGAQTRLSEALHVRPQTVNKWMKKQTAPEPDRWAEIEDHFDWPNGTIAKAAYGNVYMLGGLAETRQAGAVRDEYLARYAGPASSEVTGPQMEADLLDVFRLLGYGSKVRTLRFAHDRLDDETAFVSEVRPTKRQAAQGAKPGSRGPKAPKKTSHRSSPREQPEEFE